MIVNSKHIYLSVLKNNGSIFLHGSKQNLAFQIQSIYRKKTIFLSNKNFKIAVYIIFQVISLSIFNNRFYKLIFLLILIIH